MKLLLDTHTFIWWADSPEKLSAKVLVACQDLDNLLILSLVSVWELQIKKQIGKLKLKHSLRNLIESQQSTNRLQILPISLDHILVLENLPMHHRDPFDRLLISQAIEERLLLASRDSDFQNYDVDLYW